MQHAAAGSWFVRNSIHAHPAMAIQCMQAAGLQLVCEWALVGRPATLMQNARNKCQKGNAALCIWRWCCLLQIWQLMVLPSGLLIVESNNGPQPLNFHELL